MKRIQKLQRRAGRRQFVPDHLGQAGVSPQALKILRAFAPRRVENHEALHEGRFIITAFPLFHPHLLLDTPRQLQRAEGLHRQRDSSQRRQGFFQRLGIKFEQQG